MHVLQAPHSRTKALRTVVSNAAELARSGGIPAQLLALVRKYQKLSIVIAAYALFVLRGLYNLRPRRGRHAPCPPMNPFWGHAFGLLGQFHRLPDWYNELSQKYGRSFRLILGSPLQPADTMLVVTHPDSVKHMLKDNFENYPKGDDLIAYMHEVFGNSIFASNGNWWYHQRKTASQIFTGNNMMNEMVKIMLDNNKIFVQALKDASQGGTKPCDIQTLCLQFTMDSFCEIAFSVSPGSLAANMPPKWAKFVHYWDELQFRCPERPFYPYWPLMKGLAQLRNRGFPIPKALCRWESENLEMEKYVNQTIDEVIAQRIRDGAATKHSVIAGKESQKASSPKSSSPRGGSSPKSPKRNSSLQDETKRLDAVEMFMNVEPPLTPVELRDVVKGLILGGRDTTGVSIMWTLYEISKNPDVEAKLYQECRDLPAEDPVAFYEAMRKSKYIDAVVRETIRLYTPVPIDAKKAAKDDVMPDGTFVGQGWVVVYAPYVMARDKELWGPDASEWKPSRWLEGELAKKEPSPFVYSMFQAGPRICLGKDLALLEAKSCVAMLMMSGVRLRPWPGAKIPTVKMGMTLAAGEGIPMHVEFVDVNKVASEAPPSAEAVLPYPIFG